MNTSRLTTHRASRAITMVTLIAAGEAIFLLPFVVVRIFRPTVLDVFGVSNFELGVAFSVYGVVAMISYLFGGPLSDRFSPRTLMMIALISTAAGGLLFGTIPSFKLLVFLYGFWGLTTILLFWAALIRVTREWGGQSSQGRAYGILDGGRGLVAALISSISVAVFASLLPSEVTSATIVERANALNNIIWIFSGLVIAIAFLVWLYVPDSKSHNTSTAKLSKLSLENVRKVIRLPTLWLQAIIIICAYVGYKGTDDFSLYARDALGYNEVEAAQLATLSFWIRPFAAVGAGFIGDYISSSRAIFISFGFLAIGSVTVASGILQPGMHWFISSIIITTSLGIYALRGLYFALFQEARIPISVTGTAVGVVSFIGFTPDIFMGPIMGFLIDRSPGALGHQHVFALLSVFALIGLLASVLFNRIARRTKMIT